MVVHAGTTGIRCVNEQATKTFGGEVHIPTPYTHTLITGHPFNPTAVAQWLRCVATNRKVAGPIPAGGIGIFH